MHIEITERPLSAVVLAAVGLYGVLSTIVRQRTAEIGMRMVFGAPRASILSMVVNEGLRLSAGGIVVAGIGFNAPNPQGEDRTDCSERAG